MKMEEGKILDFTPVLCKKSGMGFEAGKVYAAYDCKMSKGVIFQGEYKFAEGFDYPSILAGLSMREAVDGVELYAPWEAEVREEVPVFVLDAFPEIK